MGVISLFIFAEVETIGLPNFSINFLQKMSFTNLIATDPSEENNLLEIFFPLLYIKVVGFFSFSISLIILSEFHQLYFLIKINLIQEL